MAGLAAGDSQKQQHPAEHGEARRVKETFSMPRCCELARAPPTITIAAASHNPTEGQAKAHNGKKKTIYVVASISSFCKRRHATIQVRCADALQMRLNQTPSFGPQVVSWWT